MKNFRCSALLSNIPATKYSTLFEGAPHSIELGALEDHSEVSSTLVSLLGIKIFESDITEGQTAQEALNRQNEGYLCVFLPKCRRGHNSTIVTA